MSFIPTLTVPPPPFPVPPAPGPRTPLLRSFRSYLPRSTFSYIRSATSKNTFSTFCPLLAEVSTYVITPFFLHQSSASSTVTALLFAASNPCASPFTTREVTVLDGAKSLLLPTSMTCTFPSQYDFLEAANSFPQNKIGKHHDVYFRIMSWDSITVSIGVKAQKSSLTTIPSSAICLRSCNQAVACSKVDRRVIS